MAVRVWDPDPSLCQRRLWPIGGPPRHVRFLAILFVDPFAMRLVLTFCDSSQICIPNPPLPSNQGPKAGGAQRAARRSPCGLPFSGPARDAFSIVGWPSSSIAKFTMEVRLEDNRKV